MTAQKLDGELVAAKIKANLSTRIAALAERVDAGGQVLQEGRVEAAPGKGAVELGRVHAGQGGADSGVQHLPGQPRRIPAPDREEGLDPAPRQNSFAVVAYVFQEEVAKGQRLDAGLAGALQGSGGQRCAFGVISDAADQRLLDLQHQIEIAPQGIDDLDRLGDDLHADAVAR